MNLSVEQLESIASLSYDPGFILLLDAIQAQIDDVTVVLHEAPVGMETQILARWRALREIYATLKTMPEELALRVNDERASRELTEGLTIGSGPVLTRRNISPERVEAFKRAFHEAGLRNNE